MKAVLAILKSKYFSYILVALCTAGLITGFYLRSLQIDKNDELQSYNRQLKGQLSDKERELQKANNDLGIAKSDLMDQEELTEIWKREKEELDEDFREFIEEHNLQISSRDRTIAKLRQEIKGGNTSTIVTPVDPADDNTDAKMLAFKCEDVSRHCVISYAWEDHLGRFRLMDPNIFVESDEITFTASQIFKIYGEIFTQEDGSLQTRRLTLREMYKDGDEYKEIEGAKAKIIDSEFQYTNAPKLESKKSFKDLFKIRMIALASVVFIPDLGKTNLGLGAEFFNFKGFGLNLHTNFDFSDARKINQGFGVSYSPRIAKVDLNVGINLSVGTYIANMFQEFVFSGGIVFYLND